MEEAMMMENMDATMAPAPETDNEPAGTEPITEPAATDPANEPATTEDIPPPPPLAQAIDSDVEFFTDDNSIKLGNYVTAFTNDSSDRLAGILVAMETIKGHATDTMTIATDPAETIRWSC